MPGAIKEAEGDRKLAAQRLQISLSGQYGKLIELRIPDEEPGQDGSARQHHRC